MKIRYRVNGASDLFDDAEGYVDYVTGLGELAVRLNSSHFLMVRRERLGVIFLNLATLAYVEPIGEDA